MKKLKKDPIYQKCNGITLVALIVIVVLILIITGVAIQNGLQSSENAQLQNFFRELQIIQRRVDVISEEAKLKGSTESKSTIAVTYDSSTGKYKDQIGSEIQGEIREKVETLQTDGVIDSQEEINDYYYYDAEALKAIGIEDIHQKVVINWNTRNVVSVDGFTLRGTTYYYDPSMYTKNEGEKQKISFDATNIHQSGETLKKVEITLKANDGTSIQNFDVKYRLEGEEYWRSATEHGFQTGYAGTYEIQVSGSQIQSEKITYPLNPTFKVEATSVGGVWNYTISTIFGQYQTYSFQVGNEKISTYVSANKLTNLDIQVYDEQDIQIGVIHYANTDGEDGEEVTTFESVNNPS